MKRQLTIFFEDGHEQRFEVTNIYNPHDWSEWSVIHFKTIAGKAYSVRTADIERVEIVEI